MKKPLAERAALLISKRLKNKNRIIFLSFLDEIKEALDSDAELSLKSIWLALKSEGEIDFSYPTFARYAQYYLNTKSVPQGSIKANTKQKKAQPLAQKKEHAVSAEFKHNPNPNLEKLI